MATSSSTSVSRDLASTAPTIYNLLAPTAGVEESQALSTGTRQILIKTRSNNAEMQIAFVATQSATLFVTVPAGCSYFDSDLNLTGVTIFIQTNKSSQTIEIREWK